MKDIAYRLFFSVFIIAFSLLGFFFLAFVLVGCGTEGQPGKDGLNGTNAREAKLILTRFDSDFSTCASGSGVVVSSALITRYWGIEFDEIQSSSMICDGTNGVTGAAGSDGANGTDGVDGEDGVNGNDGISCSVTTLEKGSELAANGGALITCGNTSVVITNGKDGKVVVTGNGNH